MIVRQDTDRRRETEDRRSETRDKKQKTRDKRRVPVPLVKKLWVRTFCKNTAPIA